MRKVFHNDSEGTGLAVAFLFSLGFTALLFGFIPFAHRVNKPQSAVELLPARTIELPPPKEEEIRPPEQEEEKPPEDQPEPQLAETQQQIPLAADLEVVGGSGGALDGFGESLRAMTSVDAAAADAFDAADLQKRPEAVSQVVPAYPPELRKAKIEGLVTLVFVLGEDGRVEDPRVENSSRPEFEKPALDAIRKWRFRPGEKDGQPVRTYIRYPIRFRVPSG
jgi:protein TonB